MAFAAATPPLTCRMGSTRSPRQMPSFTRDVEGSNADECVAAALAKATGIAEMATKRAALIAKYGGK